MEGKTGKKKNTFSEGLTELHRDLRNPLRLPTKKKIHKLYTVHPPSLCFLYLPHLCIDIPTSPRFIKHADKGLQTQLCLQKRHSLAHSQQISLLPHSSGLYLPTPLRYNGSGPFFPPQPLIVSVGSNGLLTGLGWGNSVAGLYSEVPNLPPRKKKKKKRSSRSREVAARSLIWTLLLPEKFEQRDPAINFYSILGCNASSSRCCFAEQ